MPGHGLDGPGAERYATRRNATSTAPGGTLYRCRAWLRWPGRNAMPLAERNIDAPGGTLYRCRGMASMAPGRNAMPPGGTQHRQPRAERYTDAGHGFGGLGGTPCHWRNATSTPRAERYTDAGAWPRWPGRNATSGPKRNAMPLVLVAVGSAAPGPWCSPR